MKNTRNFKLPLLLCFVISIHLIYAQNESSKDYNFVKGSIITTSNIKVDGYIARDNYEGYIKCYFKKNRGDNATAYQPGEIIAYRFKEGGEYFISKEAPLRTGNKLYFLKQLIKGKANVYYLLDGSAYYFIETDSTKMLELSEPDIYLTNKEGKQYKKPASYPGKLKFVLAECPELFAGIEKSKLNDQDLTDIVNDYNLKAGKNESSYIYQYNLRHVVMHVGLGLGLGLNSMNFSYVSTGLSPGATIGCKLEFDNLFPNADRSFLQTGLFLQQFSTYNFNTRGYDVYYNNKSYYGVDRINNVTVNKLAIHIPFTYNYLFSLGKIRPYAGFGMTNDFLINQNKNLDIQYFLPYNRNYSMPIWNIGFQGNLGTKFIMKNKHSVSLELNYEYTGNLIANPVLGMRNNIFSFMAGYTL
jgi:hypothetical protein